MYSRRVALVFTGRRQIGLRVIDRFSRSDRGLLLDTARFAQRIHSAVQHGAQTKLNARTLYIIFFAVNSMFLFLA